MDEAMCRVTRTELASLLLLKDVELDEHTEAKLIACPVRRLVTGECLLASGERPRHLYLLLSGRLSVRLGGTSEVPVAMVDPGDSAGELSLIDGQPASAYVVAETESRVLLLSDQDLWELVERLRGVSRNLLLTLARRLRLGNDLIDKDRQQLQEYRIHATVDALTGLFNRYWLNQMLPRQIDRSFKQGEPLSVVMIDIDHFKAYNDAHGHVAGDRALCAVAAALRDNLRPSDMAARYGGEEFLVLLPNSTIDDAKIAANRLRSAVERTRIMYADNVELPSVTVSIGVAGLPEKLEPDQFLAIADAALYRAKRAGRNQVTT